MADNPIGAQEGNDPTPPAAQTHFVGAVPAILARAKPANSERPRDGNIGASQFDGPFGGKRPQS